MLQKTLPILFSEEPKNYLVSIRKDRFLKKADADFG